MATVTPTREEESLHGGRAAILNPISIALNIAGAADVGSTNPAPLLTEWAGPPRLIGSTLQASDFGKAIAALRQGLAQPCLLPYIAVVAGFLAVASSTSSVLLLVAMLRTYRTTADTQALATIYGADGSAPTRLACGSGRIATYRLYIATFAMCIVEIAAMIATCALCIAVFANTNGQAAAWCGAGRNTTPSWAVSIGLVNRDVSNCISQSTIVVFIFAVPSAVAALAKAFACLRAIVAWNALFRAAGAKVDEYMDVSCLISCRDTE